MRVDELERALRQAAADQPPTSSTAYRDVVRRARRHRVQNTLGVIAVVMAVVAVSLAVVQRSPSRTRLATEPRTTVADGATEPSSPAPSTTGPQSSVADGGAVPAGFGPASVTFVSTRTGWALGT